MRVAVAVGAQLELHEPPNEHLKRKPSVELNYLGLTL